MKSFKSWDQTEIAYQEWGERTLSPPVVVGGVGSGVIECGGVDRRAIPGATLRILSGDHVGALADPRFARSIVDFLA